MHFRDFERLVKPRIVRFGRRTTAENAKSHSHSLRTRIGA
jgi:hypothetical protein